MRKYSSQPAMVWETLPDIVVVSSEFEIKEAMDES
jgi:hypothetical protein